MMGIGWFRSEAANEIMISIYCEEMSPAQGAQMIKLIVSDKTIAFENGLLASLGDIPPAKRPRRGKGGGRKSVGLEEETYLCRIT
jgi:hypothetical protein